MVNLRMANSKLPQKYIDRFWSRVDIRGDAECWLWTAGTKNAGYGYFALPGKKLVLSHRLSFQLANGVELDSEKHVCHRCDRPSCVNPSHLFVGTHKQNMDDRDSKMRQPYGEKNGQARLTESQVLEIREIGRSIPQTAVAKKFGISRAAVGDILSGRRWKHVGGTLVDRTSEHANKPSCERHAMAKLDWNRVRSIRAVAGQLSIREIARREGVDRKSIQRVIRGKTWVEGNSK